MNASDVEILKNKKKGKNFKIEPINDEIKEGPYA